MVKSKVVLLKFTVYVFTAMPMNEIELKYRNLAQKVPDMAEQQNINCQWTVEQVCIN